MKERLDRVVTARGLASSRERAQALILAGRVLVNEQKIEKPGAMVDDGVALRILGDARKYVSRGGQKLEHALTTWQIDLTGLSCMDVGASTGGFTDCMLQNRAASVLAVDTGYGQIAQVLRADPRVQLLERTNARYLKPEDVPAGIGFVAVDVSFISATLVIPAVIEAVFHRPGGRSSGMLVVLVKPQFESGREWIEKGGIVRDPAAHQFAINRVRTVLEQNEAEAIAMTESPITGAEGNREFLIKAHFSGRS